MTLFDLIPINIGMKEQSVPVRTELPYHYWN